MLYIFIILYSIFFILLSVRRLDWAAMFLLAALPSYLIRFNVSGIPSTLLEVMILVIFFVWLLQNWKTIINNLKIKLSARGGSASGGKIVSDYPFKWEMILLLLISFLAVGMGGFTNAAFGIWKAYFFEPALFYIVIFNILILTKTGSGINDSAKFDHMDKNGSFDLKARIEKIVLWPLLVSSLVVSLVAIYQKITGQFIGNPLWAMESTRRVVSFFGYPNAVGLYLAPLILIFIGWLFSSVIPGRAISEGKGIQKTIFNFQFSIFKQFSIFQFFKILFILLTIITSLLSIYSAKSVGASIGVVAGLIIFGLFASKKARVGTIAIIIIASIGILSFQQTRQLGYKYLTLNDFSGQIRKSQWDETWKMLKDGRIIFGSGLANYQKSVAPYHHEGIFVKDIFDLNYQRKVVFNEEFRKSVWQPLEIYLYPHNIFLNFWTELGLAGMLLFVWIIGKYFYMAIKIFQENKITRKQENNFLILGLSGAMVAVIVQGLVDVPYFKNDLSVMFWVMIAIIGALSLKNK